MVTLESINEAIIDGNKSVDVGWIVFCGTMVFVIQLGYFQMESSCVTETWIHSLVLKNVEDTFIGILFFSMFGYTFAAGNSVNGIIGFSKEYLFLNDVELNDYSAVFFRSLYAIACATIVSGCVLERVRNTPYVLIVGFVTIFQFPILYHWIYTEDGWLYKLGFIDYGGAAMVHMTGGIFGLVLIMYVIAQKSIYFQHRLMYRGETNMLKYVFQVPWTKTNCRCNQSRK